MYGHQTVWRRNSCAILPTTYARADAAAQANIVVTAVDSYATPEVADHRIRHHDRAIVTPYVAYYSTGSVIDAKHQIAGEIIRVLNGDEPLHPIRQTAV